MMMTTLPLPKETEGGRERKKKRLHHLVNPILKDTSKQIMQNSSYQLQLLSRNVM